MVMHFINHLWKMQALLLILDMEITTSHQHSNMAVHIQHGRPHMVAWSPHGLDTTLILHGLVVLTSHHIQHGMAW